jgi:hypothetical protein
VVTQSDVKNFKPIFLRSLLMSRFFKQSVPGQLRNSVVFIKRVSNNDSSRVAQTDRCPYASENLFVP